MASESAPMGRRCITCPAYVVRTIKSEGCGLAVGCDLGAQSRLGLEDEVGPLVSIRGPQSERCRP